MRRISAWFSLSALVLFAGATAAYLTLDGFNEFSQIEKKPLPGACTPVTGVPGPADVQIDPARKRAFISSFDRSGAATAERGAIFAFDIDDPLDASAWTDRTRGVPERFEPHGIYFYTDGVAARLFVVNAATRAIEIYDVAEDGGLSHIRSVTERRLTSPNDIVAVGPDSFYVTNDSQPGRDSLLGRLYFLLRAGAGSVLLHDGQSWRVAADGLKFANGIAINPAGDRVYVAESAGGDVRLFKRDVETGALADAGAVSVDAAPDNINVDRSGAVWIAAHPRPLSLPGYFRASGGKSPSLVLRLDEIDGSASRPVHVYADDGGEISASSAAARFGETLIIGALLDSKFLICKLPE